MKRVFSLIIAVILTVSVFSPAVFADGDTATYHIATYLMNLDGETYQLVSTEEATGVIDNYVSVTPEEIEGFSFNTFLSQPGDYVDRYGETTLTLVYDRNEWIFTVYAGNEVYDEFITYYGAPIEDIPDIIMEGYVFEGWEEEIPETMPNHDFDLHAKLSLLGKTYVTVGGAGEVAYNNQIVYSEKPILSKLGTRLSLTARQEDSEFLYWINTETMRVVSFDEVYSLNVCPYIYLRAEFYERSDDCHFVAYLNIAGTILQPGEYEIGEEIEPPDAPALPGHEFLHWSIDAETASNTSENVFIYPVYRNLNNKYTVTITNERGTSGEGEYTNEELVTVSAAKEGFSYWKDSNGEIVSYYPIYTFTIINDVVLTAVYYAADREKVACRIVKAIEDRTNRILTVYEEWSVDNEFEVHATGFVFTTNPNTGTNPELLKIGLSGVTKSTSKYYTLNGTYSLTLNGWASGLVVYIRPYVIVNNASGQHTVYGNIRSYAA